MEKSSALQRSIPGVFFSEPPGTDNSRERRRTDEAARRILQSEADKLAPKKSDSSILAIPESLATALSLRANEIIDLLENLEELVKELSEDSSLTQLSFQGSFVFFGKKVNKGIAARSFFEQLLNFIKEETGDINNEIPKELQELYKFLIEEAIPRFLQHLKSLQQAPNAAATTIDEIKNIELILEKMKDLLPTLEAISFYNTFYNEECMGHIFVAAKAKNHTTATLAISTSLSIRADKIIDLLKRLEKLLKLNNSSLIEMNFRGSAVFYGKEVNKGIEVRSFLEELLNFIKKETGDINEGQKELKELYKFLMEEAIPRFLQHLKSLQQAPNAATTINEINNIGLMLQKMKDLSPILEAISFYDKFYNRECRGHMLVNEWLSVHPFDSKSKDVQIKISEQMFKEWSEKLTNRFFIENGSTLSTEKGLLTLLNIFERLLGEHLKRDDALNLCDHFAKSTPFKEYLKMCMYKWYGNNFLPQYIPCLKQKCSSLHTQLTSTHERATGFSPGQWKEKRTYLLTALKEWQPEHEDTPLPAAPYARLQELITSIESELRSLKRMLDMTLNMPPSSFREHIPPYLLKDFEAIEEHVGAMTPILTALTGMLDVTNNFTECITAPFLGGKGTSPSDLEKKLIEFLTKVFSTTLKEYQATSEQLSFWNLFLEFLNPYKQDPSKPLGETQLLELQWKLPAELAEETVAYNSGWRAYNPDITPLPKGRLSCLAKMPMPPGSIVACLIYANLKEAKIMENTLTALGRESSFQEFILQSLRTDKL